MRDDPFHAVAFRLVPLGLMLATAGAGVAAGAGWAERIAPLPWLVSLVVVGLPHGAADLAVTRRIGRGSVVRVFSIYLACMVAVFALFMAAPVPLIVLFAALSLWHFGMGHADGQTPPIAAGFLPRTRAALARGAPVLGVPLAVWPAETASAILGLVELVAPPAQVLRAQAAFAPDAIRMVGQALLAVGAVAIVAEIWATRGTPGALRRSRDTCVDLAVVAVLGTVAPPLLSIGVYFLVWHAWRHLGLLSPLVAGVEPDDGSSLWRAVVRLHAAALPLLVPTWAVILAAWWWLSPGHSARDLALLSLAVYLVVTPSHDLLVDLVRSRSDAGKEHAPPPSIAPPSCAARLACSPP
ncbi:MAG: Brp/Blh family beta-carotene 15,15'-dioxygenase [Planctomycetia bacterium]